MGQRLYHTDFYAWTREQAEAVRAGRAGENVLDRENVAEEIESLGGSEKSACESALELIMEHLLKIEFIGPMEPVRGWRKEVRAFRRNLDRKLTPSLAAELSRPEVLDIRYSRARRGLLRDLAEDEISADLPISLPYSWRAMVDEDEDWFPEPRYSR